MQCLPQIYFSELCAYLLWNPMLLLVLCHCILIDHGILFVASSLPILKEPLLLIFLCPSRGGGRPTDGSNSAPSEGMYLNLVWNSNVSLGIILSSTSFEVISSYLKMGVEFPSCPSSDISCRFIIQTREGSITHHEWCWQHEQSTEHGRELGIQPTWSRFKSGLGFLD